MKKQVQYSVDLPADYNPLDDQNPYMNPRHVLYFADLLHKWRDAVQTEAEDLKEEIHDHSQQEPDEFDRAAHEMQVMSQIRRLESLQVLLESISSSISDIDAGKYGFCKKTGREIGLKRLMAMPNATLCVNAQSSVEANSDKNSDKHSDEAVRVRDTFVTISSHESSSEVDE